MVESNKSLKVVVLIYLYMQHFPTEHFATKTPEGDNNVQTIAGRSNNVCEMFRVGILKNELLPQLYLKITNSYEI